jgi:hypothetical protein
MADFGHLRKLEVSDVKTVRLPIYQLEGEPVLIVAPAGEANKKYFNELLKRSRKNMRRIQSQQFTAGLVAENRDDDRRLYSLFVIKGWEGVTDATGKAAQFTEENVKSFLDALPDWLFDEIRQFCTNMQNFVDSPDAEATGKN